VGKRSFAVVISALCAPLLVASMAWAATIDRHVDVPRPVITTDGSVCSVSIRGFLTVGEAGEPLLPAYGMRVLLPQGQEVTSVSVDNAMEDEIPLAHPLDWAQPQSPLSEQGPFRRVPAKAAIYDVDGPFPAERVVHVTTQTFRGYNIAFLRVYPVAYNGARQSISYAPGLDVHIETAPAAGVFRRSAGMLRAGLKKDADGLKRLVDDTRAASSYVPEERFPKLGASITDPDETYPYVIITQTSLVSAFEPLKEQRDAMGLRCKIVGVGTINSNYPGADLQEKIRNFIKDAYLNWETEYVLLGADDGAIPHRGLYADAGGGYTDDDIASDLYYGALDGNWNDDADGLWGEADEADLIPEVAVGRASVSSAAEATNFVNKVLKYENTPVVGQIKVAQMIGELLWGDPTWAGDYKDEIKYGSSANGYTTVGFPPSFTVNTLYDRDIDPDRWDKEDLIPILNGGTHLVNHLGHSDVTYGFRMYNSDVDTRFTNDGVSNQYFVLYTQGCYSGSFDNRTSGGTYTEDCLGEHFQIIENGAVAFIGNTRFGWGEHLSTNGASQYFDREFFDAVFGEGITTIGNANDDSKVDNIPFIDLGPNRWVYYELVLLGDPAMDIWTDTPGYLTLNAPDVIYAGDNEVEMEVMGGGSPVEGARVSIMGSDTYNSAFTDDAGIVRLDPRAGAPGSLVVAVRAHNYYTYGDTIPVVVADHAVVVIDDYTVEDGTGGGLGNSNGVADDGETIQTVVTLRNVGQDSAFGVWGLLETADPFISLIDSGGSFGDIAPDDAVTPPWGFLYDVSPAVPDSHLVTFTLNISAGDTSYTKHFGIMASAPVLGLSGMAVSDTLYGNGDGCISAGETIELSFDLENRGSGDGEGVSVSLSSDDPYLTLTGDSAYVSVVPAGDQATPEPAFVLGFLPDCPEFHRAPVGVEIRFADGRQAYDSLVVTTGGSLEDDMESGSPAMSHTDFMDGRVDQWHLETYRNHTTGGGYSWKFGGAGSARYSDFAHGALVTPDMCVGPNATFTFWHVCRAETMNATYAWDGGIVEISTDHGESWSQITPVGGYPKRIYPNADSPFEADTPCFAWAPSWTQVVLDLTPYEGSARIRFRFGSDAYVGFEGWYIDDLNITDDLASVDIDERDLEVVPTRFALHRVSPNPFSASAVLAFDVPRTSRVLINLYDVRGRVVETLADSMAEPGRYSVTLGEGVDLPSGVYFVKMSADGFSQSSKVIVIK
jgi:hypothetical protein